MRCAKLLEAREQIASRVESEGRNELLVQEHVQAEVDEELRVARPRLYRVHTRLRPIRQILLLNTVSSLVLTCKV